MKRIFAGNNILLIITGLVFFADVYLLCVFPANLVLDLFWDKIGKAEIEAQEYNYGQLAGLPAGEGVTPLNNIEQYNEIGTLDYITFETDSIIPMDAYKLKSATDKTNNTYRVGQYQRSTGKQWATYTEQGTIWKRTIYNRYYLVKLPDGNYVAAYLDDAYYWKYKLTGKVQLPVGYIDHMDRNEQNLLQAYIDEHELSKEKILIMFSQERYENHKGLYSTVPLILFVCILVIYIAVAAGAMTIIQKRR